MEFVLDDSIEEFYKKLFEELKRDFEEAEQNASYYLGNDGRLTQKEINGSTYNDALRLKGTVRERQMKLLTMMNNRLKFKEERIRLDKANGSGGLGGVLPTPEEMMRYAEEIGPSDDDDDDDDE